MMLDAVSTRKISREANYNRDKRDERERAEQKAKDAVEVPPLVARVFKERIHSWEKKIEKDAKSGGSYSRLFLDENEERSVEGKGSYYEVLSGVIIAHFQKLGYKCKLDSEDDDWAWFWYVEVRWDNKYR